MRERWIQISAALLCGMGACAGRPPSTTQLTTHPTTQSVATTQSTATELHQPVAPPPPVVAVATTAIAAPKIPVTQPVILPVTPTPATTQPGPIDDKVGYGIGYAAGRRIHDRLQEDGRAADHLKILRGVIDGLEDSDPAYNPQEVEAAYNEFQAYTLQRRAEKMYADNPAFRKHADENLQKSHAILDQNAEMAGVDVRPDGVQVQILSPGNAKVVGNAKTITVKNLRVSLADGTLVKSTDADQTGKFEAGAALPALLDALRGMKVGTKARVWLPPDKAYGLTGKPPEVGPNQAIEYEFELVNAE